MPAQQHPPSLHTHPCAVHVPCLSVHVLCLQQESEERTAEQKIVYAVPFDEEKGPAVKQEFKTRKVYNNVDELSLLPFAPPSLFSYAASMLAGTFKVGTNRHSQSAGASQQSARAQIVVCCALVHRWTQPHCLHSVCAHLSTIQRLRLLPARTSLHTTGVSVRGDRHGGADGDAARRGALMVLQGTTSRWQDLLFVVFIS